LSDYDTLTEKWEDVVYVSCRSSIGPNTSDIISYILYTYTNYKINNSSFNTVASQLPYRSDFGIYERKDALQICQEIAWQARCALIVDSETIELRYLALQPDSLFIFTTDNIQFKSFEESLTDNVEVTTRLIGTWRESMEWTEPPTRLLNQDDGAKIRDIIRAMKETERREVPATNVYVYEENMDIYGVNVLQKDIFIYNFEEAVAATITFWGHILANVWKIAKFKTFLSALPLQTWDAVTLNVGVLGKGIVEEIRYDTKEKDVYVSLWMPIREGKLTVDTTVWNG